MTEKAAIKNRIVLGDRVPRFSAPLITGGSFDLHVSAGRWVVLSFLGSPSNPQANVELANLLREADLFREDHLVVGCVFTEPPGDIAKIAEISGNALFFLADYDGDRFAYWTPGLVGSSTLVSPQRSFDRVPTGRGDHDHLRGMHQDSGLVGGLSRQCQHSGCSPKKTHEKAY